LQERQISLGLVLVSSRQYWLCLDASINTYIGQFLRSPHFTDFLSNQHFQFVTDIHPSLNNSAALAAIIKKQQLLDYPFGSDIAGK
jgi:hypothetical protein